MNLRAPLSLLLAVRAALSAGGLLGANLGGRFGVL